MKLGIKILIAFGLILLVYYSYKYASKDSKLNEIQLELMNRTDSLESLQLKFDSINKRYNRINKQLSESTKKLHYLQQKLDTITSNRIETFTEIQTRLIEIKLALGEIPIYHPDSTDFRFE